MADNQKPSGPAFGHFPQMKPRRAGKSDVDANVAIPRGLARGALSGVLGAPGDLESLARLPYELITGNESPTYLPTSEDIEKRLPYRGESPLERAATGVGQLGGGLYMGPGAPIRLVGGLPTAVYKAGKDFAKAAGKPAVNVIKPKGGNWLGGSIEGALKDLKRPDRATGGRSDPKESMAEMKATYTPEALATMSPETRAHVTAAMQDLEKKIALNDWVDRNLGNYVKKEMATPEDPVRKLADQGITHMPKDALQRGEWLSENMENIRRSEGFPGSGMATTDMGRGWENLADEAIQITAPIVANKEMLAANPWLSKLDPNQSVYRARPNDVHELGFDHILDVLRQDVASGRIRPDQLNKVSMEQAVRRTYEFDQEMAKKMREAQIKATEGMPVHKDYADKGYKWIELKQPEPKIPEGSVFEEYNGMQRLFGPDGESLGIGATKKEAINLYKRQEREKILEDALKYEGDTMGHCVGGYCPDVLQGRSRIYSLRDAKGEPHVTVEVQPSRKNVSPAEFFQSKDIPKSLLDKITEGEKTGMFDDIGAFDDFVKTSPEYREYLQSGLPNIVQIKGKGNAKPKAEYLPYVQDFVKSGQWSDVGDLANTDLYKVNKDFLGDLSAFRPSTPDIEMLTRQEREEALMKAIESKALPESGYVTRKDWEDAIRSHRKPLTPGPSMDFLNEMGGLPPEGGMKKGGAVGCDCHKVHISDNPDTMRMELDDKKMAGGGLASKLAKLARAAPKSKEEIEAIAQRIAPQVTGEFVRGKSGTQSVAGKTQKQFQREKDLPVDIRPTKGEPHPKPETIDYEKLKGNVFMGIPGDTSITGQTIHGVGDIKMQSPSPQHGGPMYGHGRDDSHFWASGLNAARRVQNLAKEIQGQYDAPVLGKYVMMGPEGLPYAQHFADANLEAIDLSKMTKRQIEGFNNLLRKGSPKSGPRPSFPGIEDKGEAYLHFAMDPELRKHFNQLMEMPTITTKFGLPSGQDVRFAVTEPDLRNLEVGVTGKSIGQMKPDVEDLKWSEHPTYSHDIPGHFLGSSAYPVPYELSFPDTLKAVRENPKQAPQEFGSLKMVGPRQIIDQQLIDEIRQYEEAMKRLTGKKAGGAIKKAEGGSISADDLILEERKL